MTGEAAVDGGIIVAEHVRRTFTVAKRAGWLRRTRSTLVAVDDVSLTVERGEAVGYIGPNGAGKSTTIKILTGLLAPTAGQVRVCGMDPVPRRRALARRIGVVFGQRSQLWWDLPLRDSFELLRWIHRVDADRYKTRWTECVELLDMADFLDIPVRELSLGQRMRGEVTAALLHTPELLILDEPTIGLDIVSKDSLRDFLVHLNVEKKVTVLLATNDLPDIEHICERLVVIDQGRILFDGTLTDLTTRFGRERTLIVVLEEPAQAPAGLPGVTAVAVSRGGRRHQVTFRRDAIDAAALIAHIAERLRIRDLTVVEPDIDHVVRELYHTSIEQGG